MIKREDLRVPQKQFRVLYREFLFRMVDLEILSAHALGDSNKLLGQFAALLLSISLLLSFGGLVFAGSRMPPLARLAFTVVSEHFLIATTMLAIGLFAVLSWDSTFPNRRDVLVLSPLPVRSLTMFAAKVAAVATALSLTVLLLHGAAGIIWPIAFAVQATPQTVPAFTLDPTPGHVSLNDLKPVLDRALHQQLSSGWLAPGTGGGLTVGVSQRGVRRVLAYGTARPDSLFEIGSVTKTFTSLMLARMVVDGCVKLDDPVRLLLPPGLVRKPRGDEITLLDIATQHSDLPRAVAGDWREYVGRRGVGRLPQPPFQYSNFAFGLLGQVLADRAGLSYSEFLKKEITGPLRLNDTVVSLSNEQQGRFIQGYNSEGRAEPPDAPGLPGSGAIRSTAGDLLRYLEINLHPEEAGGTFSAALSLSHIPRAEGPPGQAIGLAWLFDAANGTWAHGGAMRGFTSMALFQPKGDLAVVALLNRGPYAVDLAALVSDHIRQRLTGEPAISLDAAFVGASRGLPGTLRWFGDYWFTMLSASTFVYCCVLGVQGLAAEILPRRVFLRASSFLQLGAFCLFVCVYFLQPGLGGLESLTQTDVRRVLLWIPSYWFLGLFHQLNGSMLPVLAPLAQRAWIGLAIAVTGTAAAYALSYLRTLRRIVEEPDILPGSRTGRWLPPFGTRVQTAIGQFSVRSLVRSRQHRVILAFYLGIGFAFTIFLLKAPAIQPPVPDHSPVLAASIMMMVLAMVGTRVVFVLPLELRANWIFRITGVQSGTESLVASRHALLLLSAAPVWTVCAVLCGALWPWREAAGHLALLGLLGIVLADIALLNFRKLPFTCSYLPGKSQVHMVYFAAAGLMWLVILAVKLERRLLQEPGTTAIMLAVFVSVAIAVRLVTTALSIDEAEDPRYEEAPVPAVLELGLHRDGALTMEPS